MRGQREDLPSHGGGGPFPLPAQFWDSEQADQKASTNVTGFKNARVDEILKLYEKEFDVQKRAVLLRELDGIVMAAHNYILDWTAPYERMVYWNKLGQPKGIITALVAAAGTVPLVAPAPPKPSPLQTCSPLG